MVCQEEINRFLHEKLYPEKCWHEWTRKDDPKHRNRICRKCKIPIEERTYDNPDYSTMPVEHIIKRLVEMGEWAKFNNWVYWEHDDSEDEGLDYIPWLISQPRFSNLLLQYWGWDKELFKEKGE